MLLVLGAAAAVARVALVALVVERNETLAESIRRAAGETGVAGERQAVVAVLGMVHMNGVSRRLLSIK